MDTWCISFLPSSPCRYEFLFFVEQLCHAAAYINVAATVIVDAIDATDAVDVADVSLMAPALQLRDSRDDILCDFYELRLPNRSEDHTKFTECQIMPSG